VFCGLFFFFFVFFVGGGGALAGHFVRIIVCFGVAVLRLGSGRFCACI